MIQIYDTYVKFSYQYFQALVLESGAMRAVSSTPFSMKSLVPAVDGDEEVYILLRTQLSTRKPVDLKQ